MTSLRTRSYLAAVLWSGMLALGCGEQVAIQPDESGQVPMPQGPSLRSASGLMVPEMRMRGLLERLTHDVALAVRDPAVRKAVYDDLHASPYSNNQVHFRTFVEAHPGLLDAIAAARGQGGPAAVLASFDSLINLEFLMPVPEHWSAWDGGADLLVASSIRDHELPVAFSLDGRSVPIASAEEPPSTPALVIKPVETDFSRIPRQQGQGGKAAASQVAGVYMTSSTVYDDHESWPFTPAEFEVHVFRRDAGGTYTDVSCSGGNGALQGTDFYYDQNDVSWSGNVLLISEATLGTTKVEYHVWEDDDEPCTATGGRPPKTSAGFLSVLDDWEAVGEDIKEVFDSSTTWKEIKQTARDLVDAINVIDNTQTDDSVGVIEGPMAGCYEAEGPVQYAIHDRPGGSLVGYVFLNHTFGVRTPICPLDASIAGPSQVYIWNGNPDPYPSYAAEVSGGSGTISYQWWDNNDPVSTTSGFEMSPVTVGPHTIHLLVTRGTESVDRYLDMEVSEGSECNPDCAPARSGLKAVRKPARRGP